MLGIGRSGVAAAQALLTLGLQPVVVDEGTGDSPARDRAAARLAELGVEAIPRWSGEFADLGAESVVVSPAAPKTHAGLLRAEQAGIEVIGEIELAYRVARAPIVAITGTNGKSTTTVMTWLALRAVGRTAWLCGNIYGSGYAEVPLTEAALAAGPDDVLVAEVSSFQLERVSRFRPRAAAITNLTPDHLNRYRDFADYATTKRRVFAAQVAHDTAVVPLGVPAPKGPLVRTFGGPHADARVEHGNLVVGNWSTALDELPFAEPHNVLNAQTALLLGEAIAGTDALDGLADGLHGFRGLVHRMERVGEHGGVLLINNSMCTNPAAVLASSDSVQARVQHLLVGGANKSLDFAPLKALHEGPERRLYLFGSEAQAIDVLVGGRNCVFDTLDEAFAEAVANAEPGDVVMLAPGCASTDQFEDFRERGELFRRLAKEWLER